MKEFKYELKDHIKYDQGPDTWHFRGQATVIKQNSDFLGGPAYLLQDDRGFQCEVKEEQILGKV